MHFFDRRQILGASAATVATLAMPSILRAQDGPIRIGTVLPQQGPFAQQGQSAHFGFKTALAQVGNKVRGRPVELVVYDDPSPLVAQQNARKLISEDKVVAIVGGQNSSTGLALHAIASEMKVPTVLTAPIVRDITGKNCNPHVFRCQASLDVYTAAVKPTLLAKGKKFYYAYGGYAFGQESYQVMKAALASSGGTEVGSDSVPVGTTDFSSYVLKIRQAKPDAIFLALAGNDLAAIIKQIGEFGLKIPLVCNVSSQDDLWAQSWPEGHPEFTAGVFWQYNNPSNSPGEKALNDASLKATGRPASQSAAMAWVAMRMLLESLEKSSSLGASDIVEGLVKARLDGAVGYFREWDHQLIWPIALVRVKDKIASQYDILDTVDTQLPLADIDKLSGTEANSLCKMSKA
jgi:branched-chain amino acid transport system substrate-binding protein